MDLLADQVPDETTILHFRHFLEEHGLQASKNGKQSLYPKNGKSPQAQVKHPPFTKTVGNGKNLRLGNTYKKKQTKENLLDHKSAADRIERSTRVYDENNLLVSYKDESRESSFAYDHDGRLQQTTKKEKSKKDGKYYEKRMEYKYNAGSIDRYPSGLVIKDGESKTMTTYVHLPDGERVDSLKWDFLNFDLGMDVGGWYKRIRSEKI